MRLRTMNSLTPIRRGLGITAGLDPGLARDLAVRCEDLGYHSLWSNDEPASPAWRCSHTSLLAPRSSSWASECFLSTGIEPAHIASEISRHRARPRKALDRGGVWPAPCTNGPSCDGRLASCGTSFRTERASC